VKWSVAGNGTARTVGSSYTFDASESALDVANTQLGLAEATYAYAPIVDYSIAGKRNLADHMFMSPRVSKSIYNDGSTDYVCS
jgi:hypothetical protein